MKSTEAEAYAPWDDDREDEPPPPGPDWHSCHMFFLAPVGKEFQFEDETEGLDDLDDTGEEDAPLKTYPGEGCVGCAVGICLAASYAMINPCQYAHYEDGSTVDLELESCILSEESEQVSARVFWICRCLASPKARRCRRALARARRFFL